MKPIHAFEMLDAIEKEVDPVNKTILLQEYGVKVPLNFILSLNFNEYVQLDLPEGMPPIDVKFMDQQTHPDFMGLLASHLPKLRHCTTKSDLKKFKKEQLFMDVLINCPLKDAEILCSAKDKALEELYPSISAEFVAKVFPTYVQRISK